MLGEVKEQPVIEIEALSVERSGRGVDHGIGLRNVSLQLKRGEVMVLAGEHGCGTSLLGSLILGGAEPGTRVMSGSILFEGEELIKARRSRKRQLRREEISYLSRNIEEQFNPNHTVRQCLRETAKLMGRNKPALPESEWSDPFYRVGIVEPERVLLRRISELSHLMIRKLGLMRALLTQSQLLICDHALGSLDRMAAYQFVELLHQLGEEAEMAVLMMSGSLRSVERFADRVAVFYEGGILEAGTTNDIIRAPKHLYTKEFLKCVPDLSTYPEELPAISREAIREAENSIHGREAADAAIQAAD